jgi:hypothetical protein
VDATQPTAEATADVAAGSAAPSRRRGTTESRALLRRTTVGAKQMLLFLSTSFAGVTFCKSVLPFAFCKAAGCYQQQVKLKPS